MSVAEEAIQHLRALPEPMQAQVLEFIEQLEHRAREGNGAAEDAEWSAFSLAAAMRGMEDEPSPYSTDDLKERFS
ncbi:MAG: hypothetical protein FJ290_05355 [Planctomycetes bacterium]|nr:hypothetical protein [Planctomycetota bacterium]